MNDYLEKLKEIRRQKRIGRLQLFLNKNHVQKFGFIDKKSEIKKMIIEYRKMVVSYSSKKD